MRRTETIEASYFDELFRDNPDPWRFRTSRYEASKYCATLAALSGRRYGNALEVGCANGVFTRKLAACCQTLTAVDISVEAIAIARHECQGTDHVSFKATDFLSNPFPATSFDLMVLSEVVYYWSDAAIVQAANILSQCRRAGGSLLLVHWTGPTDYPQSGDEAVLKLQDQLGGLVQTIRSDRHRAYRLDLWEWQS